MQAIYKSILPKQGQPQQEPREMTVTAHYDLPVVPGNVNKFSNAPCPEGCTQAVAYSMGRRPRGGDRT